MNSDGIKLSEADATRIKKVILVNILKKIEAGGTPTMAEQRLIDEAAMAPLDLESKKTQPPAVAVKVTQKDWAEYYEVDKRQIIRWNQRYQAALQHPAPFHDPHEMVRLWPSISQSKVSEKLLAAASKFTAGILPPGGATPEQTAPPAATPPAQRFDLSEMLAGNQKFDFSDAVKVAELQFQACAQMLRVAMESGDGNQIRQALPAYNEATETLRKTKLAASKIGTSDGDLLRREQVTAELQRVHGAIPKTLRKSLFENLLAIVNRGTLPTREQLHEIANDTVDKACAALIAANFESTESDQESFTLAS